MSGVLERLRRNLFVLLAFAWMITVLLAMSAGDRNGASRAGAQGQSALDKLRLEHESLRASAAEQNLIAYRQQVERANQAEQLFLESQDEIRQLQGQLNQERIAHVSTQYRPAPGAAPVPAPRVVITCGWLRDFNAALGASVPAPAGCRAAAGSAPGAWPTAGSDTELLESGVSAADVLAHARDYGAWALTNLAQLNGFRRLHKDSP